MKERLRIARSDSDAALFPELLCYGELVLRTLVAAMVSAVQEDSSAHRYQLAYKLVRASGLGEWTTAMDEVLVGVAAQHLQKAAADAQRDVAQALPEGTWQHRAVTLLDQCLAMLGLGEQQKLPMKVSLRRWLSDFVVLRNGTRGHGAMLPSQLASVIQPLEQSIDEVATNAIAFHRDWAYLHRNLSGKYRVTPLADTASAFDDMRRTPPATALANGVFLFWDQPSRVELADSDPDLTDFLLANGNYTAAHYELLSHITGVTRHAPSEAYGKPPGRLGQGATDGLGALDVVGGLFTNAPRGHSEYVPRAQLESELSSVLLSERHPVITLSGRGGVGKTSLALQALHAVSGTARYECALWFSARDIDLLPEGPKPVQPQVVTVEEIAAEFFRLLRPAGARAKRGEADAALSNALASGASGPTLFVFDNFETLRNPVETYKWLDTYLRPPNKILITTRHREFKGDYNIEVRGMSESEAEALIEGHASRLGVRQLIDKAYRENLYREADGHPYVLKVLLGEVAKARRAVNIQRIVAGRDDILTALFERTYASLSPVAQRVLLTLGSWRSSVPQLALEAVLLRPENERMDVRDAVEELERFSLVEVSKSEVDDALFVAVPFTAQLFAQKKLLVSPWRTAILADKELLQDLGAVQRADFQRGAAPAIERLVRAFAARIAGGKASLEDLAPMLEMIARGHRQAWLLLSELYEEHAAVDGLQRAQSAVRKFLEQDPSGVGAAHAWRRLASLYGRSNEPIAEFESAVEYCFCAGLSFVEFSDGVSEVNRLSVKSKAELTRETKDVLRRLVRAFESRTAEAGATDLSRLAWLHLQLREEVAAKTVVQQGLRLDPYNSHLNKLARRLDIM